MLTHSKKLSTHGGQRRGDKKIRKAVVVVPLALVVVGLGVGVALAAGAITVVGGKNVGVGQEDRPSVWTLDRYYPHQHHLQ